LPSEDRRGKGYEWRSRGLTSWGTGRGKSGKKCGENTAVTILDKNGGSVKKAGGGSKGSEGGAKGFNEKK